MKGRKFTITEKTKKRTKSIVLSIVALLELVLLVTSVTFSWFEGLTALEIKGENFKTAAALNSHIELGENKTTTDKTYSDIIDLTKFFDAQKEVRLSPVSSSDAVNFYAAYDGVPEKSNYKSLHYRKLTKEDVNSNVIQFSFTIASPDGPTDVYFTEVMPIVYINGTARGQEGRYANPYRFAFSDGTTTTIFRTEDYVGYSAANAAYKQIAISDLNSDDTPITTNNFVRRPHEFTYYSDHREKALSFEPNNNNGVQKPINSLFHLDKNETKTITVSVWMEALDYECLNPSSVSPVPGQEISFSVKLCTSWSINREITVYDYTADQWVDTYDEENKATAALYVRSTDGKDDNNRQYELTHEWDADNKCNKWTGYIPIALQNCEFLWGTKGTDRVAKAEYTFQAPGRGNATEITFLGDDAACVWGLTPYDEEGNPNLVNISFRDYTTGVNGNWIANKDDQGNDIDIAVEITYGTQLLDYDMTASPTKDDNGKNSWSCWIPKTVDTVMFYRRGYNDSNSYVNFNYWKGTGRGTNTVYCATGTKGQTGTDIESNYVIYVSVDPSADMFKNSQGQSIFTNGKPYISITKTDQNKNAWYNHVKNNTIDRTQYYPLNDEWPPPATENELPGALSPVPGKTNLWYLSLTTKPEAGTDFTVWTESAHNFNNVRQNMSFGVFEYDGTNNTIVITSKIALTVGDVQDNYALKGRMDSSGSGIGFDSNAQAEEGIGKWGEIKRPDLPTNNSIKPVFVHTMSSGVTYVEATFTYENFEFTVDMKQDSSEPRNWTTSEIPNSVSTGITFKDNLGNVWTDTGSTKTSDNYYYYAKTANGANSTGTGWRDMIDFEDEAGTSYFKHYDNSVTTLTATFTYDGVPFTVNLKKSSDYIWIAQDSIPQKVNSITYTDSANHKWEFNDNVDMSSTNYCYALSKSVAQFGKKNLIRIYYSNNYSWSNIKIHYWGGTSSATVDMIKVATNEYGEEIYCTLMPISTGIVFMGNESNGTAKQSVDITSNILDMNGFYFTGWSGDKTTAASWTADAETLNR